VAVAFDLLKLIELPTLGERRYVSTITSFALGIEFVRVFAEEAGVTESALPTVTWVDHFTLGNCGRRS
jgi:hypothetical protein